MARAATHSHVRSGASTAVAVAAVSRTREMSTVAFPPIRSSTNPKRNAPAPAATLSAIPNTMMSSVVKPNVPAA